MEKAMRCMCGKAGIWERKNEGRSYCRGCFIRQMEAIARRCLRKSGVCDGDNIGLVDRGDAQSAMMKKIAEKSLSGNRKIRFSVMRGRVSGFTKIAVPDTVEEAAAGFLEFLAAGKRKGCGKLKIIFPLSGIRRQEAVLYCRLMGIRHSKSRCSGPFEDMVIRLDRKYPGIAFQAVTFAKKVGMV